MFKAIFEKISSLKHGALPADAVAKINFKNFNTQASAPIIKIMQNIIRSIFTND